MTEAEAVHRALVATWRRLYEHVEGSRFEERGDLRLALAPQFPIPQFNGPWVSVDSEGAAAGLAAAVAEIDAAGAWPWVQARSRHERVRAAAHLLGFVHEERIPALALRPGELREPDVDVEIGLLADHELGAAVEILADAFEAPVELFVRFAEALRRVPESRWYVARAEGEVVSTGLGTTLDGATGVFNVATPAAHRRRGYGAALTARAVRDGFAAGAELAYLQSSEAGHGVYRALGFRDVDEYVLLSRPLPG